MVPGVILVQQQVGILIAIVDEEIQIAIVVNVTYGQPTANLFQSHSRPGGQPDLSKSSVTFVVEKQVSLGVGEIVSRQADIIQDMAVGHNDIQVPVVVDVEKGGAKSDQGERGQIGRASGR